MVGIAPAPFNKIALSLGLDFAQQQWLEANCEQKNDLYQFLNAHLDEDGDWREDAKDFAREAVDSWMDGAEVDFEEKIIYDEELLDCQKTVLEALKETPESRISEILNDFSGEGPESRNYDWKVTTGNLGVTKENARTEYGDNLAITTVNIDRMASATDIKLAATFIHESIDAWLGFYFNQEEPKNIYDEYVEYYNAYINKEASANNMGHNAMADVFRNRIKNAIKAYGESKGYVINDSVYEALAWGGLTEIGDGLVHPKFLEYVPNANTRSQILNILNAERHNQLGFGNAVPKGQQACN
ncbi:MAG TPA: hypothetical protein VJ880_02415 [Allomuricauda sp.]|nr:hypothetical protein [Allomuricauda sp.]